MNIQIVDFDILHKSIQKYIWITRYKLLHSQSNLKRFSISLNQTIKCYEKKSLPVYANVFKYYKLCTGHLIVH